MSRAKVLSDFADAFRKEVIQEVIDHLETWRTNLAEEEDDRFHTGINEAILQLEDLLEAD